MANTLDNSAYIERAAEYDVENAQKSRTMLKKAGLISSAIRRHASGPHLRILEIGCGTGLFTSLLARQFPEALIVATDAFAPMLEIARGRLSGDSNVRLVEYDAETKGSFSETFDVICGVDVIHHLNDPVAGLLHWRTLATGAGRLVFFESNARNPVLYLRMFNRPEEARFKYNTRQNLTHWAAKAGWCNVSVEHVPIHLPNGPRRFWGVIDGIESVMHTAFWRISGGMIVSGRAGTSELPSHSTSN